MAAISLGCVCPHPPIAPMNAQDLPRDLPAASALLECAQRAQQMGRLDEAESQFRQLLQRFPDHPEALYRFGILLSQRGQKDEAIALVRQSLALAPQEPAWHNNLGNLLAAQGSNADAAQAFMAALQIAPRDPVVWNNLGAVLLREGLLDDGGTAFGNALLLDPQFEDALINQGHVHARQGRSEQAAHSYCTAYVLRSTPDKPKRMLGIAYYTLGRIDEAAQVYRSWLDDEPDNPIARHLWASCSGLQVPPRASDDYLETHFDNTAGGFDANLLGDLAYCIPERLERALAGLTVPPGSLDILDTGCGTGLCGARIAPFARRLVGVDLSGKSLALAEEKGVYAELVKDEAVRYMTGAPARFDLVVAGDTFIYFGDLAPFLHAAADALGDGGLLMASVEECPSADAFRLNPSGRYSHRREYVETSLAEACFELRSIERVDIRFELGKPVGGLFFVARKA